LPNHRDDTTCKGNWNRRHSAATSLKSRHRQVAAREISSETEPAISSRRAHGQMKEAAQQRKERRRQKLKSTSFNKLFEMQKMRKILKGEGMKSRPLEPVEKMK
jgi:hypothetical protein